MNVYKNRIEKLTKWMVEQEIDAVVIQDAEESRSRNLYYLSGMESDGILIVFSSGETCLVAWDMILAEKTAIADKVLPYNDYDRDFVKAVKTICNKTLTKGNIEVSSNTSFVCYQELSKEVNPLQVICRADGLREYLLFLRSVKDSTEIEIYKKAGRITNQLIAILEDGFKTGTIKSELDAAMIVEKEGRLLGAEGSSFETLAAGPERSWGIHCVPAYSAGPIATKGLSIIDCGLMVDGYATDITMTVCRGVLSRKQQEMVELTQKAHELAVSTANKPNISAAKIAKEVDDFFESASWYMPHGLGHGIGLDVHEAPILKNTANHDRPIRSGMIFTIEPGLYEAQSGGVRLENDYLMTDEGLIPLTKSRIIHLPDKL